MRGGDAGQRKGGGDDASQLEKLYAQGVLLLLVVLPQETVIDQGGAQPEYGRFGETEAFREPAQCQGFPVAVESGHDLQGPFEGPVVKRFTAAGHSPYSRRLLCYMPDYAI